MNHASSERFQTSVRRLLAKLTLALALISFQSLAQELQDQQGPGSCPDADIELATRGDITITLADLDAWMVRVPRHHRPGFIESSERVQARILELLRQRALRAQAAEGGLVLDDGQRNELRAVIDNERRHGDFESLPLWDCEAQRTQVLAAHERIYEDRMLANRLVETTADEAMKDTNHQLLAEEDFMVRARNYFHPERRSAQYLFVSDQTRPNSAALERAQRLLDRAMSGEAQFGDLLVENSDSPTLSLDQGMIADLELDTSPSEFHLALFSIETPGEFYPQPVATEGGYLVFRLHSIEPRRDMTREEALPFIVDRLETEFRRRHTIEMTNQFNAIPVDVDPSVLDHLRERYGDPANPPAPRQ